MRKEKKIFTSIGLEPNQLRDLWALAKARNTPLSALLRSIVEDYLADHRAEIPAPEPDPRQLDLPETVSPAMVLAEVPNPETKCAKCGFQRGDHRMRHPFAEPPLKSS